MGRMRNRNVIAVTAAVLLIALALLGHGAAVNAEQASNDEAVEIRVSGFVYSKAEAVETAPVVDQCGATGQCDTSQADSTATATQKTRASDASSYLDQVQAFHASALDAATKNLKDVDQSVRIVLQQLQTAVKYIVRTFNNAWDAVQAKYRVVYHECAVLYDIYLSDFVNWLAVIYRDVADVVLEGYAVVSAWVAVVVEKGLAFWNTHEEVRTVTHHLSAVLLLVAFGAAFFAVYAIVSTIPDSLFALLSSLDDLTRAQLKIAAVLAFAFAFYHLRSQWSFWGGVGIIGLFYYWSGHVVADVPSPLQRPSQVPVLRKSKTL